MEVTPMRIVKISPQGFSRLMEELLCAEIYGYNADDCTKRALTSVGLTYEPTNFIVDYTLSKTVFPFTEDDVDA